MSAGYNWRAWGSLVPPPPRNWLDQTNRFHQRAHRCGNNVQFGKIWFVPPAHPLSHHRYCQSYFVLNSNIAVIAFIIHMHWQFLQHLELSVTVYIIYLYNCHIKQSWVNVLQIILSAYLSLSSLSASLFSFTSQLSDLFSLSFWFKRSLSDSWAGKLDYYFLQTYIWHSVLSTIIKPCWAQLGCRWCYSE